MEAIIKYQIIYIYPICAILSTIALWNIAIELEKIRKK